LYETTSIQISITNYQATAHGQLLIYDSVAGSESIAAERYLQGNAVLPNASNPNALQNLSPGRYYVRVYTYEEALNFSEQYKLVVTKK
jgi:hypothetical protein